MILGVLFGFGAALSHSASYLFSRLFVIRRHQGTLRLLVLGHLIMGAFSAIALPALWPGNMPPLRSYLLPLLGASGFYLLGQAGLFLTLRRADASRVSPLLGLKVPMLALFTVLSRGQTLSPAQWAAVALAALAAILLSRSGGPLGWKALAALLATCFFYCCSDLSIVELVKALRGVGQCRGVLVAVALSYALCGLFALLPAPWVRREARKDLPYAVPFAVSWMLAMIFLYACFARIGVVFGNIIQSTRGLISVAAGAHLARMGLHHLEKKTSRAVLAQRLAAAALMTGAIALFLLGAPAR